jgi:hypothetical protein
MMAFDLGNNLFFEKSVHESPYGNETRHQLSKKSPATPLPQER